MYLPFFLLLQLNLPLHNDNGSKWCTWNRSFATHIVLRGYLQHLRNPSQSKNGYMVGRLRADRIGPAVPKMIYDARSTMTGGT